MKKLFGIYGVLSLALMVHTPAFAEDQETTQSHDSIKLASQDKLTGDWGGARSSLEGNGVSVDLSYTTFYQGMFAGTGDHGFDFGDRIDALIDLDFGKLGLWEGGGLHTHLEYNFGKIPAWLGGSLIPLNLGAGLPLGKTKNVVATSLYFSQKLSDAASLKIGKIDTIDLLENDPFFGGWRNERFMNCAISAPLSGVLPPTIIGGIFTYKVNPITWTFMVYDPNDQTANYALNDLFSDGVGLSLAATWSGELAGRASSVNVNGIYNTQDKVNLEDYLLPPNLQTDIEDGTWHFAVKFSHLLIESSQLPGKGLGVYGKAAISDGDTNVFQSFFSGGLAGHGMVPNRSNDVFGVGYYYYNFSDEMQDATSSVVNFDNEQGVEMFYNFAVTPWLKVTADLQWIDPASGDNKQIWLGILRASITF